MRRVTALHAAAAVLASALLIGCPGDDSKPGPEKYADFCRVLATTMTSRDVSCGLLALEAAPFKTAQHELQCAVYQRAVDAGRMHYDANVAGECLAASAHQCVMSGWLHEICTKVVSGAVVSGGACRDRADCAEGTRCIETGGDVCAFGICDALVPLDSSCSYDQPCVPGAECFQGSCQPLVAITGDCSGGRQCISGAQCLNDVCQGPAGVNESCTHGRLCVTGAICYEGVCRVPLPAGAACDSSTLCATGVCSRNKCTSQEGPSTGVPYRLWGNLGDSCVGQLWSCKDGLRCAGGTCVLAPKLMDPCGGDPYVPCLEGYCSSRAGEVISVCMDHAKLNESCSTSLCEPSLRCDPATITCIACP